MREFLLDRPLEETASRLITAWREANPQGDVREHAEERSLEVVLDTFDGLLAGEGLACRWRDGRLVVLDGEERELGAAALPELTGPIRVGALASGQVRAQLAPIVGQRALLALARVDARVRRLDLLDDERKTVARLSLLEPAPPLPATLRLLPLRGYEADAAQAERIAGEVLGLVGPAEPLAVAAVRATGHPPEGISAKVKVALAADEPAPAAVARVLLALLDVIEANVPGALADLDSEFLHDLRVSVRRTRAVQRELRAAFPAAELTAYRAGFKWLQAVTGEARDLDVLVEEFEKLRALVPERQQPELEPLLDVLVERRAHAHERMRADLRSERALRLVAAWRAFLHGMLAAPAPGETIGELAGARTGKVYRRMVRRGEALGPDTPVAEYHELRKQGKELRYLLELFGAELLDPGVVGPAVKRLKALQDVLGRHQDREVQQATLGELADAVGETRTVLAMGALGARLADDERLARSEFAEAFEAFAGKGIRRALRAALP